MGEREFAMASVGSGRPDARQASAGFKRMVVPTAGVLAVAALLPGPANAHAAFGDLGPFYASLLHPLADPSQGLLVVAAAVFLARQPLSTVRTGWLALALCGAAAVAVHLVASPPAIGIRTAGIAVALIGVAALSGFRFPTAVAAALAAVAAAAAGLAVDLPPGLRAGALAVLGGATGIALLALLVWGGVDLLARRIGPIAGAVAGAWVAAIGIMAAALPT